MTTKKINKVEVIPEVGLDLALDASHVSDLIVAQEENRLLEMEKVLKANLKKANDTLRKTEKDLHDLIKDYESPYDFATFKVVKICDVFVLYIYI